MMLRAFAVAALAASLAGDALAQDRGLEAHVLVVESATDFAGWLQQRPAPQAPYPRRVHEVAPGQTVHFPIVATNLRPPASGVMQVVADLEFVGPDGKRLAKSEQCCRFVILDRADVKSAMLGPTLNMTLDGKQPSGTYTVVATVSDGTRQATATTSFRFAGAGSAASAPMPGAAAESAPRLQMSAPARNPGGDQDKRDCLALPTPEEVIRCSEKK